MYIHSIHKRSCIFQTRPRRNMPNDILATHLYFHLGPLKWNRFLPRLAFNPLAPDTPPRPPLCLSNHRSVALLRAINYHRRCYRTLITIFGDDLYISQRLQANEGRLRRLKATAGLTDRDADPWARCRGARGGVAAGGKGTQLRNYIRRLQLEKSVSESSVTEVGYIHTYGILLPDFSETILRDLR